MLFLAPPAKFDEVHPDDQSVTVLDAQLNDDLDEDDDDETGDLVTWGPEDLFAA